MFPCKINILVGILAIRGLGMNNGLIMSKILAANDTTLAKLTIAGMNTT